MSHFVSPVDQHASRPVHAVRPEWKLTEALELMTVRGVSSLAVTDGNNRLLGVVSRTDILREGRRAAGENGSPGAIEIPETAVARAMTTDPLAMPTGSSLKEAAARMVENRIHRVFITDGDELAAVLTTRDLMDAIALKRLNKEIRRYASSPVFTIRAAEPLSVATERLEKARVSGLVVLDGDWPVGIFAQREALAGKDLAPGTPVEELMSPSILLLDDATPLHRAAAQARATRVRRVVALQSGRTSGILTGLDFARACAE
jgi:predicted transcriptional regulator